MVEGLKQMRGFFGLSKSQEKVVLSCTVAQGCHWDLASFDFPFHRI